MPCHIILRLCVHAVSFCKKHSFDSNNSLLFCMIAVSLPRITTSPCDQTKIYGDEVSFSLNATSNGTLSYQWYKDGELVTYDTHPYCDGAMTPTLKIRAVLTEYEGTYSCLVSNEAGSIESDSAQLGVGKLKADIILLSQYNYYGLHMCLSILIEYLWFFDVECRLQGYTTLIIV